MSSDEERIGGDPEWIIEELKRELAASQLNTQHWKKQAETSKAKVTNLETRLEQAKKEMIIMRKRAAKREESPDGQQSITSMLTRAAMLETAAEQFNMHMDIFIDCATDEEILATLGSLELCVQKFSVLRTDDRFSTVIRIGESLRWQLPKEWTPSVARQFLEVIKVIKAGSNYDNGSKRQETATAAAAAAAAAANPINSVQNFSFKTSSVLLGDHFGVERQEARAVIDDKKGDIAAAGQALFQQCVGSDFSFGSGETKSDSTTPLVSLFLFFSLCFSW